MPTSEPYPSEALVHIRSAPTTRLILFPERRDYAYLESLIDPALAYFSDVQLHDFSATPLSFSATCSGHDSVRFVSLLQNAYTQYYQKQYSYNRRLFMQRPVCTPRVRADDTAAQSK